MTRVFTDFHHSSLLRSTVMLFEHRFGMEVYRPIGLEWWRNGFWAINDQADTARQFLSTEQAYKPGDGTPQLNKLTTSLKEGAYLVQDPGGETYHKACTFDYFKDHDWDYVIASIPAHVPLFERLIAEYAPEAKLIVQMGNNWPFELYEGKNVLASVAPRVVHGANVKFYHQEIEQKHFYQSPVVPSKKIYSFTNVIKESPQAWEDFQALKKLLAPKGYEMKAFGGQCPDGNMTGPRELSEKMHEAEFIFHVKPGGDGFGHIIHNAYLIGRPVILRKSYYRGQLAEDLFTPGTYIDLDEISIKEAAEMIVAASNDPRRLEGIGLLAAASFRDAVNYNKEAREIRSWLDSLE